jgi:hypothetical protein
MKKNKTNTNTTQVILLALGICSLLGIFSAYAAKVQLRHEEFRVSESDVQLCPDELSDAECALYPVFNANSSGGYEGYPFVSGEYYCADDNDCLTVKKINVIGNVSYQTLNVIVFAVFYFLLFLGFLWIRTRVRHNLNKHEPTVT